MYLCIFNSHAIDFDDFVLGTGIAIYKGEAWWIYVERACKKVGKPQSYGEMAFSFLPLSWSIFYRSEITSSPQWSWTYLLPWSGTSWLNPDMMVPSYFMLYRSFHCLLVTDHFIFQIKTLHYLPSNLVSILFYFLRIQFGVHFLFKIYQIVIQRVHLLWFQVYQELNGKVRDAVISLVCLRFCLKYRLHSYNSHIRTL